MEEIGERTEIEVALGLTRKALESQERFCDEEDVFKVARAWSLDPSSFEDSDYDFDMGKLGEMRVEVSLPVRRPASASPKKPWWKVW